MPHPKRAGVAPRDKAVVLAAVDLHLVVIEAVHEIARRHRVIYVEAALRVVDPERRVGKIGRIFLRNVLLGVCGGETAPDRRQYAQFLAVTVGLLGSILGHTVGLRKEAEEIIEAAVLGIDHDDRLDAVERFEPWLTAAA